MNKNFRVITINGIRGIFAVIFVVLGLIAGFIISPGWVCMHIWNYAFEGSGVVSAMNIYQGIMLWAVIALTFYALNNKRALIGFGSYSGLSPEQIRDIMNRAKLSESVIMKNLDAMKKKQELDSAQVNTVDSMLEEEKQEQKNEQEEEIREEQRSQ